MNLPRVLPLEGASNVRDLGGWPAQDGLRVRLGCVYRSAALARLTEADAATLKALGLRSAVDLRGRREAASLPSAIGRVAGVRVHHLPIEPSVGASLRDIAATREATGEDALTVMRQAYVAYALEWAHRYRALFALLMDPSQRPLMFNCSAGKDRTGFGAALILTVLGVPYEAVREDYLASNRLWRPDRSVAEALEGAAADTLLRVHGELLDAAFAAIAEGFGTFERYAAMQLGIGRAERDALRSGLCEG